MIVYRPGYWLVSTGKGGDGGPVSQIARQITPHTVRPPKNLPKGSHCTNGGTFQAPPARIPPQQVAHRLKQPGFGLSTSFPATPTAHLNTARASSQSQPRTIPYRATLTLFGFSRLADGLCKNGEPATKLRDSLSDCANTHLHGVCALPCGWRNTPNRSYRLLLTTPAELFVITCAVPNGSKWCHSLFLRTSEMPCKSARIT